jgi:hypothetical protein
LPTSDKVGKLGRFSRKVRFFMSIGDRSDDRKRDDERAKPKPAQPQRPDRPDRPQAPPSTAWSDEEAALVQSHYDPTSEVVNDDDDVAVNVPAPEPEVFAYRAPATKSPAGTVHILKSLVWRRTVIPILLTCGVLLIGIGSLRWLGGAESIFADMSIPLSATLCGSGLFLLLVAVLNMLQVKAELAAAARRERMRG